MSNIEAGVWKCLLCYVEFKIKLMKKFSSVSPVNDRLHCPFCSYASNDPTCKQIKDYTE